MKEIDLELLHDKATELGCSVSYLVKDYYAVHLMKCLQTLDLQKGSFIFTGGTALAKAYKVLGRFSEDCDFIFLMKSPSRKYLSSVRKKILNHLNSEGFIIKDCKSRNESKNWVFEIEYERLSPVNGGDNLRPELKLEVVHKEQIKGEFATHSLHSYLAEARKSPPEIEKITCIAIEEICAGKLSALIWRYLLEEKEEREAQHIRHLYDIAVLTTTLSDSHQFKDIFKIVVMEDLKERTELSLTLPEAIDKMLNELEDNKDHKENYQIYVKNFIYGDQLPFEEAVKRLRALSETMI